MHLIHTIINASCILNEVIMSVLSNSLIGNACSVRRTTKSENMQQSCGRERPATLLTWPRGSLGSANPRPNLDRADHADQHSPYDYRPVISGRRGSSRLVEGKEGTMDSSLELSYMSGFGEFAFSATRIPFVPDTISTIPLTRV
jgi:hypothetical protein